MDRPQGPIFRSVFRLRRGPKSRSPSSTEFEGYGGTPSDFDFRVENRKTGAGVRQRGDHPISKLVFWSIGTTVCPEAYVHLRVEPGKETAWRIQYEFYTL